jgi:hypothetical protein
MGREAVKLTVGVATWFVSNAWLYTFVQLLEALEQFFAGEPQGLDSAFGWTLCRQANTAPSAVRRSGGLPPFKLRFKAWATWSWSCAPGTNLSL